MIRGPDANPVRSRRLRLLLATWAVACLTAILSSCDLSGDGAHTYLTFANDTAWAKFDSLEVSWIDTVGGGGGVLFQGDPAILKPKNRVQADGYDGQPIQILFKGFRKGVLAFEEHRGFNGSTGIVTSTVIPIAPGPGPGPSSKVRAPRISAIKADTLLNPRDSTSFRANALLDSGTLKAYAFDYDGDGTVEDSAALSGGSALLAGGHRYGGIGIYAAILRVYSADSMSTAKIVVRVVKDEPNADAGADQTVYPEDPVTLTGSGKDGLGTVVRQEWKVGGAAFTVGAVASFKAPAVTGDVVCLFRVMDDDSQVVEDAAVVHVISRTESNLTGIAVSAGGLSPQFNPSLLGYADTVGNEVEAVTVTPTGNGEITVNGVPVGSGKASPEIGLKVGNNPIDIAIRLPGASGKTFQVNVVRLPVSADANLSGLIVSAGDLDSAFNPDDTLYAILAPNAAASTTIKAVLANAASTLVIGGFKVASGSVSGAIPLTVGSNSITVEVTAKGGGKKTYTLTILRAGNGNPNLSALALSAGVLTPPFNAGITEYAMTVGAEAASTTVTATPENDAALLAINGQVGAAGVAASVPLVIGANPIAVQVTAQDGNKRTYTVRVTRVGNKNADLSGLSISAGPIVSAFSPEAVFYTLDVPNGTTATELTATVAKESSSLSINGQPAISGKAFPVALEVGANPVTVMVSAQSGDKKSYTVVVNRAKNGNADLQALALSIGGLSPVFAPEKTAYTLAAENESAAITVTPTVAAATSTLAVNGKAVASGTASSAIALGLGANPIEITVTAQNGAVRIYTIIVTRAENGNADLSGLAISPGILDSAFSASRTLYHASLANSVASLTVTPSALNAASGIAIGGKSIVSGTASQAIPLAVGENPISVEVTAGNGAKKTYLILANREGSANADLASLSLSAGTLDKSFAPNITSYSVSLPNTVASVTVTAAVAEATASLAFLPGATVALQTGLNEISVEVTAQNKSKKIYAIHATRAKNGDADLADLKLSGGTIPLPFQKATKDYSVSVENSVGSLTVTPSASSPTSAITVKGGAVPSGTESGALALAVGANALPVVVTAEDGTAKTYTVTVTRANDNPTLAGLKDTTISINDAVDFKLTAADPQGIKQFQWDFNGDGTIDATTAAGSTTHAFPGAPQTVNVSVTVQDNLGASTKATAAITIVQDPPVVSAGNDTSIGTGRPIPIKGSAKDGYGKIAQLEWSIGGGAFIKASKPDTTITAPASPNPAYEVILRATDDDGNVVTDKAVFKVEKIQYVTVGDFGFLATSPDGITWTKRNSGITEHLYAAVWTGTQFVVVGSGILTSPDGIGWTLRTSRSLYLETVVWTGTQLVAAGGAGRILTSPDGMTWTTRDAGTKELIASMTWTGSKYLGVASNNVIVSSTDGISWTAGKDALELNYDDVAWTGSMYVAVGNYWIVNSSDGAVWKYADVDGTDGSIGGMGPLVQGNGRIIAMGSGGMMASSTDGAAWKVFDSGSNAWFFDAVWSGNQFVAVGSESDVYTSPDGAVWTKRNLGYTTGLVGIAGK
jgi:hypothetical protein